MRGVGGRMGFGSIRFMCGRGLVLVGVMMSFSLIDLNVGRCVLLGLGRCDWFEVLRCKLGKW